MRSSVLRMASVIALALTPALAVAQDQAAPPPPPHKPLEKTIGQARPEIVPSLIVMNSDGATLENGKLTLTGIATNSIVFADRPVRAAGHAPTSVLLEEWADGSDSFAVEGTSEGEHRDGPWMADSPKWGAGRWCDCFTVKDGKITRDAQLRLVRDGIVICEDSIASLKRFKDDAKEVAAGFECGITLAKFQDIKEGDVFECFKMEEYRD